jgi:FtsP/CotA-like multicopper oxidase with cupredoxin domain
MPFYVLTQDANPRWTVLKAKNLLLPPGRRFDVLVTPTDVGTFRLQTRQVRMGSNARWTAGPAGSAYVGDLFLADQLATIRVAGPTRNAPPMPAAVTAVAHLPAPDAAPRTLIFDEEFDPALPPAFRLRAPATTCDANGVCSVVTDAAGRPAAGVPVMLPTSSLADPSSAPPLDSWTGLPQYFLDTYPGSPGSARLGSTEEWTLYNFTPEDHPFHIHTNSFELVAVNGVPVTAPGMSDTEVVPHATMSTVLPKTVVTPGSITVRMTFSDYTGDIMMHCHISEHLDSGMITVLHVA